MIAESHKRRTLQKSDVAAAIAFSDMFDFLIDIVPREDEEKSHETERENEEGQEEVGNEGEEMGAGIDEVEQPGLETNQVQDRPDESVMKTGNGG